MAKIIIEQLERTSRFGIPYPKENANDWWDIEHDEDGRMDSIDKILYASMENQVIFWDPSSGHWSGQAGEIWEFRCTGDVDIKSPAGGVITFENGLSIRLNVFDYLYIDIPSRPLVGNHTGAFHATSEYLEHPDRLLVGWREKSSFHFLRPLLVSTID